MKRLASIILLFVTFATSFMAQVPQETISFDTGENGCYSILKSDIDSIVYSAYDMDSVSYAPNMMTQVIYTKHGVYRAPLSAVNYIAGIGNNPNDGFIRVNLSSSDAYQIEVNSAKVDCRFESNEFNNCRYGIMYSLSPNPTESNFVAKASNYLQESTSATFMLSLPLQNYKYYYRPYVIANNHTYFGDVKSFNSKVFRDAKIGWTEFYKSANGDKWTDNSNWCSDYPLLDDFHHWYGMGNDSWGKDGVALYLNSNNVTGDLYLKELDFSALYLHDNNINSITLDNCYSRCSRAHSNKGWKYYSCFTLDQNLVPVSINMKKSYLEGGVFVSARNTSCKDININDCWFSSSSNKKDREFYNHGLQIYTKSIDNLNIQNCKYLSDIQGNRMGNYVGIPMGEQDYFPSGDDLKRVEVNNMTIANTTFTPFNPNISGLGVQYKSIIRGFNIKNLSFRGINSLPEIEDSKIESLNISNPQVEYDTNNEIGTAWINFHVADDAEIDTLHITGDSLEQAIFFTLNKCLNLNKIIIENAFEATLRTYVSANSISFTNVERMSTENVKNIEDIYIKQCKFYSLPSAEANTVYHITNSIYHTKINDEWCDVGITNFVGTREQFIKQFDKSK